jgi:hypothetical protein
MHHDGAAFRAFGPPRVARSLSRTREDAEGTMKATNFDAASQHLNDYLGIDLTKHLRFSRPGTLRDYSVIGSLVVVYRYAEALERKLVVHDMTTGGHKSHLLGTELDFDLSNRRRDPMEQLHVIGDMLRIRKALGSEIDAFRLGLYVDYFSNTEADSYAKYQEMYGDTKTAASMHIGVRYKWTVDDYQGRPFSKNAGPFAFWGKGSKGFKKGALWAQRIRSWPVGFVKSACDDLATDVIATDFRALDANPPNAVAA